MSGSAAISPTAHYTGYIWFRGGLSHPALATRQGRLLFESLQPAIRVSRLMGGPTLESYLLARHRAIDALVRRAIDREGIEQVIEVAAGLSPRGWRFARRYGERVTYIEADLPEMAARKRAALTRMDSLGRNHRVHDLDALSDDGLAALSGELDPARGLLIITEGLLGYLPTSDVLALWRRFADALGPFAHGRYVSDLHLGGVQTPVVRGFRVLLSAFVRGRVHLHFQTAAAAEAALERAGFARARVERAAVIAGMDTPGVDPGARLAHIIEASTK